MNTRVKLGIGVGVVLVTLVWLAASGFQEAKTYYYTVDEVVARGGELGDARLRVSGEVLAGSIVRRADGLHFQLGENGREMPVVYAGLDPVPDTFKDHAKAVIEGRLGADGRLVADKIQAKCASKYEAMAEEEQAAQAAVAADEPAAPAPTAAAEGARP